MRLTIVLDREEDDRCIAEALTLLGVMSYEQTRDEATATAWGGDRAGRGPVAASP